MCHWLLQPFWETRRLYGHRADSYDALPQVQVDVQSVSTMGLKQSKLHPNLLASAGFPDDMSRDSPVYLMTDLLRAREAMELSSRHASLPWYS